MQRTRLNKVKLSRKEKLVNQVADYEMLIMTLEKRTQELQKDAKNLIEAIRHANWRIKNKNG